MKILPVILLNSIRNATIYIRRTQPSSAWQICPAITSLMPRLMWGPNCNTGSYLHSAFRISQIISRCKPWIKPLRQLGGPSSSWKYLQLQIMIAVYPYVNGIVLWPCRFQTCVRISNLALVLALVVLKLPSIIQVLLCLSCRRSLTFKSKVECWHF